MALTDSARGLPRSLRLQLTAAGAIIMLLLGTATAIGAWVLLNRVQDRVMEDGLGDSSERLIGAISQPANDIELDTSRLDAVYHRPLSGHYYLIRAGGRQWRSRSLWDMELELPADIQPDRAFHLPGPGRQELLALSREYIRFDETITITVAIDYSALAAEFRRGLSYFIVAWILAVTLTLAALYFSIGRSLRPLANARNELADIQSGGREKLSESGPAELQPLLAQINTLLDETRDALLRSRNALANLGHALKTPLAVLGILIEREDIRRHPELHRALRAELHQLNTRIQRELSLVRSEGSATLVEPFVPARDLPPLVTALKQAHQRDLSVSLDIQADMPLPCDRADMLEVLGNILDNAFKWARSQIIVSVARTQTQWQLSIEDDGPGIAAGKARVRALSRGQRLDEDMAGQGLGLAIAGDIVNAWSGKMSLEESARGGLAVRIWLPSKPLRFQGGR